MRKTYSQIKGKAKHRFHDRLGDGVLIIVIPLLIVMILGMIFDKFIGFLDVKTFYVVSMCFSTVIGIVGTYISIKVLLPYLRGKDGIEFENFFKVKSNVIPFVFLRVIIAILFALPFIELIPTYIEVVTNPVLASDTTALEEFLASSGIYEQITASLPIMLFGPLVLVLILVRFNYAFYIIVDREIGLFPALKMSWQITRGNFFRVFFFPLSFILWIMLGIVTCGLGFIYVAPYLTISQGYMYFTLMEENGEDMSDSSFGPINFDEVEKTKEKSRDPLDDYYM